MTHTATPWRVCNDGRAVSGKRGTGEVARMTEQFMDRAKREANARFIVTACNHHEEAVKLLNECFDELGGMDGQAERRARIYAVLASIKEAQL